MWKVVGQLGQAWNQSFQAAEEPGETGVSSTQEAIEEVIEPGLPSEQYLQIIHSKQAELSSLRGKYETIYTKCKALQSSYETDITAERSVIEALKVQIMEKDKEQTENNDKAEAKFSRLKQQARARIQELSKEIDVIKRGQEGDGSSTANVKEAKLDDLLGASPSSSRTATPDRTQQEAYEKEGELEELRRECLSLKQEKSELETNLSQLEEQLSQLQPIKNELKTSLASNNRVEQENAQLQTSMQEASVKSSLLESRINEVIEDRKKSEDNLDLFKRSKLKEFQEVIRSKSEEIEALNNSLSLLRIEYGEERTRVGQLESQVASLKEEKELSRQRYQELVLQVEGYTRDIEQLRSTSDKDSSEAKESNSETALRGMEGQMSELESKLQESEREVEQSKANICNKDLELGKLVASLEEFQNEKEAIAEKLRENSLESDELRHELSEMSASKTELEKLSSDFQARADRSKHEAEALSAKLQNAMSHLKERDEDYAAIEAKFREAEARLRDLDIEDCKKGSSEEICQQLEERNQVLSLEIEEVSKELSSIRQSNSSLSKVKQNLEEGLSIAQSQTEAQKTRIEELADISAKLSNENNAYQRELSSVRAQLEEGSAGRNERESLETAMNEISEQLCENKSECTRLTKEKDKLTQEREALERNASEKISSLEIELEIMSARLSGVQDMEQALKAAEQERASHSQRVNVLEADLRGREGERVELEILRETGASSQQLEQQLRDTQEEFQEKISGRDLALEKLSTEKKQVKDALDKSTESVNTMKLSLDSVSRENSKLINDVDRISREKVQLAADLSTFQDELSRLHTQLQVKETETNSLLKTTETASNEMGLLHSNLSARDEECRQLREKNALVGGDAKRMQEGFDSALELMQDKLKKSEARASQLEVANKEFEQNTALVREERTRAETLETELQEKLKQLEEHQTSKLTLQSENQRLIEQTAGQSSQLESGRCELEGLLQENVVLRTAQENTFSGAHDQEVRSLQLSQEMAVMSRENEQHARKLTEVNKLLESAEFERDQLKQENASIKDYATQLQSLQLQFQQITVERNGLKERGDALSRERDNLLQENSHLQSLQSTRQDTASPPHTAEVPAATSYYVTQLEERLQNVGYAHAKELQRLNDMLEGERHKSSQMEEAMRMPRPSEGLPLPATAISEDLSCLNQPTLDECVKVFKHQIARWRSNPKIAMTRFFKSRPVPQLLLIAYFVCLHFIVLISIF